MQHVCLPCHNIANVTDTCIKLQSEAPVCSLKLLQHGIKVDILSCGGQGLQQDFGIFERNSHECVSTDGRVPVLTVVMADCWTSATLALRCHSDGTWGEYGVMTRDSERMEYICQPRHINSPLCGRKPRYQKMGTTLDLEKFYTMRRNLHPWLMGLKKRERYECSATLITSTWLITAAHCVIRSQESHNQTLDPRNLKVQLTSQRRSDRFVSEVVVHPEYRPGRRPLNDIALIRLERPLIISDRIYPACVDLNGDGFITSPFAMTFSRSNGDNIYEYKTVLQQVDPACHSPVSHCRSLRIENSQFCGVDLDEEDHLPGGSSGGPFMQNLDSDHAESWAVSGIVSFSVEKQLCGLPITVYTAIHLSSEWIQDVIYGSPLF
ncbi:Serine proteases trypsin domain [Trinorchestia longiramus]|nr:Serine proteases trypsin domain [Trinorchestia longiramus]